jgi:Flp pilus assembly protein TadG/uncharacterized protein YegL
MQRTLRPYRGILSNDAGNFGMMTAVLLPVLLGTVGLAIDTTNVMMSRRQLQDAADAAALAVSGALAEGRVDATTGQKLGKDFLSGQLANHLDHDEARAIANASTVAITTTTQPATGGKSFAVSVRTAENVSLTPFTGFFAGDTFRVSAASRTASGSGSGSGATTGKGLSLELLLDESASMAENTTTVRGQKCVLSLLGLCLQWQTVYVTKVEALKQAAATLFDSLDRTDPNGRLVRTGTISYTNGIKAQSAVTWGTSASRQFVNAMTLAPTGGTDATAAVTTATSNIQKNIHGTDAESVAHAKKNNTASDRVMILMTDGEMTGNSNNWSQKLDLTVRNGCASAKAAGITIFTVAFMAPEKGRALLRYCASAESNYFEPNTMDGLVASFKTIAENATKPVNRLTN